MPDPKPGESMQDFVSRCVPIKIKEGKTQDQALGACYGIYRNAKKSQIFRSLNNVLRRIINKALPPGTRRKRSDGTYEKQSDGSWKKIRQKPGKEQAEGFPKNISEVTPQQEKK